MDFEKAVSFSLEELGSEEIKKDQQQKSRIVQVTALELGWLQEREKQCFGNM